MSILYGEQWTRKGISLLWGTKAFQKLGKVDEIVGLRKFFELAQKWPDELPFSNGNALAVAGLEGCLDALSPKDATQWLENTLYPTLIDFQTELGSEAALIFWLPDAKRRLYFDEGREVYRWHCAGEFQAEKIDIGRCIWNGVEREVQQIMESENEWVGLYHTRVS